MDEKDTLGLEFAASGVQTTAHGIASVGDAVGGLIGSFGRLLAIAAPVSAALGSLGGALTAHKVTEIAGAYEGVRNRMAGTLNALGFSDDFAEGLKVSAEMLDQIYATAAKLPGEAEDYIEVFTNNLPQLQSSLKGGLDEYVNFSNKYTAVAKSLQVDTMQASMDLQRMLQTGHGGAGLDVRTFTKLLPYLHQIQGQAALTAQSFNAMTDVKRADLLGQSLKMLDPMVSNMANSWDAVVGAVATAKRDLLRLSTEPLFDAMKASMQTISDLILNSNGKLTTFGRLVADIGTRISDHIGGAMDRVNDAIENMSAKLEDARLLLILGPQVGAAPPAWVQRVDTIVDRFMAAKDAAGGFAAGIGFGGAASKTSVGAGAAMGGLAGAALTNMLPGGAIVGALLGPFLTTIGAGIGAQFGGVLEQAGIGRLLDQVGEWFTTLKGPLMGVADGLASFLDNTIGGLINQFDSDEVSGWFSMLGDSIKNVLSAIGPFADAFGQFLGEMMPLIGGTLKIVALAFVGAIQLAADALGALTVVFKDATKAIHGDFGGTVKGQRGIGGDPNARAEYRAVDDSIGKATAGLANASAGLAASQQQHAGTFSKWLAGFFDKSSEHTLARSRAPQKHAVGNTVQDFRGSRFTIQQDFDKKFDPDRVAVAFAKDVERIGTKRLQSAFEPLFGI